MKTTMGIDQPAYIDTFHSGALHTKIEQIYQCLKNCMICPRRCAVNRLSSDSGLCQTGVQAAVSSYTAHFGEETPLVGQHGSGTIFFTHCNLLCNFCQNYDISHEGIGVETTHIKLAEMMLALQAAGCHNINFVTPSHVIYPILAALSIAIEKGLSIPLVYNTSAYDNVSTLQILNGVFDIYMPDFKFWSDAVALQCCNAPDYPEVARKAILEMHRQVGDLQIDSDGIARRGLLIRHLVMPDGLSGTNEIVHFIANEISLDTYVNIMPQYRPCGKAHQYKSLSRRISSREYQLALEAADNEGLTRIDRRGPRFMLF